MSDGGDRGDTSDARGGGGRAGGGLVDLAWLGELVGGRGAARLGRWVDLLEDCGSGDANDDVGLVTLSCKDADCGDRGGCGDTSEAGGGDGEESHSDSLGGRALVVASVSLDGVWSTGSASS